MNPTPDLTREEAVFSAPAAVVDTCEDMSPERLEQCREIFRLHLAGTTQQQIADKLSISRPTVARRLSEYRVAYRKQLESEAPTVSNPMRKYP